MEIIGIPSVNTKGKQGPGKANITSTQNFRTKVWNSLEKTFSEEIYMHCKQVNFFNHLTPSPVCAGD